MTATKTRVQRNGRDTSWAAALLQTPERTAPLYRRIRAALDASGPMTDEELLRQLQTTYPDERFSPSGVRSRRNELVLTGWVTEERNADGAVVKRRGSTNGLMIVWRNALEGEEAPTGSAAPTAAEHDHAAGLEAARDYANWHIGDPDWADKLVAAYLNPEATVAQLREEGAL